VPESEKKHQRSREHNKRRHVVADVEDAHKLTCFTGKIERSGGERREGPREESWRGYVKL
jgi:hypothetical protein